MNLKARTVIETKKKYQAIKGIFFWHKTTLAEKMINKWTEWKIEAESLPDKLTINGKEYELLEKSK
jgi:hypothetical protein